MKKLLLLIAATIIFANSAMNQDWVSFTESTPSQPIVNLATSNNQSVSFSVEFCGMYKNDIIVDNKLFQRISIQSCGKTNIEKIFFISQGFV